MLTIEKLKSMEPKKIFAHGHTYITNFSGDSTWTKWVAIRGGIHDWAIYISYSTNLGMEHEKHLSADWMSIAQYGDKLCDDDKIRELVPCTDEAFEKYRY